MSRATQAFISNYIICCVRKQNNIKTHQLKLIVTLNTLTLNKGSYVIDDVTIFKTIRFWNINLVSILEITSEVNTALIETFWRSFTYLNWVRDITNGQKYQNTSANLRFRRTDRSYDDENKIDQATITLPHSHVTRSTGYCEKGLGFS